MKPKVCKHCKETFQPVRAFEVCCGYQCSIEYARDKIKNKRKTAQRKAKKEFKENDKAYQMKLAQQEVNTYVRLRDANVGCCTCDTTDAKWDSGHFLSAGGHGSVRFNTLNIHKQCFRDNRMRSGAMREYREFMVKKYGEDRVERLEAEGAKTRKYSVEYLRKLTRVFKKKNKQMRSRI